VLEGLISLSRRRHEPDSDAGMVTRATDPEGMISEQTTRHQPNHPKMTRPATSRMNTPELINTTYTQTHTHITSTHKHRHAK
jgi:hypothetical protein